VLSAVATFGGIDVSWSYPTINPSAVAHTLLYRSTTSNLDSAAELAVVAGNRYYDKIAGVQTYYYWIRIVSVNGTVGEWIGPASATTNGRIADLIQDLTGQIDAGVLAQALKEHIDRIDLLRNDLQAEIFDRQGGSISLAQAIEDAQNGVAQALTFLSTEVAERTSADAAQIETLEAQAATLQEGIAAVQTYTNTEVERLDGGIAVNAERIEQVAAQAGDDIAAVTEHTNSEITRLDGRVDATAEQITTAQTVLGDNIASVQQTLSTNINLVGDTVQQIGALYTAKVEVNGLIGGFGVYNNGSTVEAGFDLDLFWVGRTQENKRKPFIIKDGVVYIDQALINELTFTKLKDELGTFIVANGQVKADYIDTKGLAIRDTSGNIIFSAGTGLSHALVNGLGPLAVQSTVSTGQVTGLGSLAVENYVAVGSNIRLPDGSVMGTADFINRLSRLNAGNIGTFMDAAAIGSAFIGNLAVKNAHIDNLVVGTEKITPGAASQCYSSGSTGTYVGIGASIPANCQAVHVVASGLDVITAWGGESTTDSWNQGYVTINGTNVGPGGIYLNPGEGYYSVEGFRASPAVGFDPGALKIIVTVYKR
jgi:hypothetical protein